VGYYEDAGGAQLGFRRDRKGRFTTVNPPGASHTIPVGINERGQVVGYYLDAGGSHGFRRDGKGLTTIDVPGAVATLALGINNRGQIAGFYVDAVDPDGGIPPNAVHGFVRSKGSFTRIDIPGAGETLASDLNDRDEIVGAYGDAEGKAHGFRLRKGVFTTIDPPGAVDVPGSPGSPGFLATVPFGINNRGQVVGQYADAQGLHAYLLDKGVYMTIDPPGGDTTATDINDRGQIVIPAPRGLFIQR
jgi:uncharacterized membrane protein